MQNKYLALALVSALAFSTNARAEGKNGVAAVVNGEEISVAEIKKGYEDNPQIKANVPFDDFYAKALDIYVNGKLVYQAAVADDITNTPEYKEQLKTAQEDVARKVFLEKKVKSVVTDAKIKEAYNKYKSEFQSKKEIKARHILVSSESQANDIIAQLKKGAKFDMKKGQVSQAPVKTQFGYHVVSVDDVRDSKPLPLKDLRQQIEGMLTQQEVAKIFNDLNNGAKVEKYSLDGKVMPNKPAK